jgi:hypothetical protein
MRLGKARATHTENDLHAKEIQVLRLLQKIAVNFRLPPLSYDPLLLK